MSRRSTRIAALGVPIILALMGPLVQPAQAATAPSPVTEIGWNTTWYHGGGGAIFGLSREVVGASAGDPTKLNGSLKVTQLGIGNWLVYDYYNRYMEDPVAANAPRLAEFVGTDSASTPRFQAFMPIESDASARLDLGVLCSPENHQFTRLSPAATKLSGSGQWTTYAWPTADDDIVPMSPANGTMTMADYLAECPDAVVHSVGFMGAQSTVGGGLYLDNVSLGGQEFDFVAPSPLFTGLAAGEQRTSSDGNTKLAMQSDGNLVLYVKNSTGSWVPQWWTGTKSGASTKLTVQPEGNVLVEGPDHWEWQTSTFGSVDPAMGEWAKLSIENDALEVVNQDGEVIWSSADDPGFYYPAPVTTLTAGQSATAGNTALTMQPDGNAVVYYFGQPIFNTGTFVPGSTLKVQPDGNIVVYNPNGDWLWQSGTYGNPGATAAVGNGVLALTSTDGKVLFDSTKNAGVKRYVQAVPSMASGAKVSSLSTQYRLDMQADGNLVLWDLKAAPVPKPIWNSGTHGNPGAHMVVQPDGNMVIYTTAGKPVWNTGTWGNANPSLNLQDDGNLVLYSGVTPKWWTKK